MDWNKLLTKNRICSNDSLITPSHKLPRFNYDDFMEDYTNIISSAVFRRLQDKTQVFPLDTSDFVRTRLTHSLEVSAIASKLGLMIHDNLSKEGEMQGVVKEDLIRVLACSGLLHDLGNPPFGHFGEKVIGNWFKEHLDSLMYKGATIASILDQQMLQDLYYFEGNAQTLRLLSKSRFGTQTNITKSVVSVLIKYPVSSLDFDKNHKNECYHKIGYFKAEQAIYNGIIKDTGLKNNTRHPLTYLLEAADDIAYITADLEDAYKKELFKIPELHQFLIEKLNPYLNHSKTNDVKYCLALFDNLLVIDRVVAFKQWILMIQMYLLNSVSYSFVVHYDEITEGHYPSDLFKGTYHEMTVKLLKDAMKEFVFTTRAIVKLELSCSLILTFLLDHFVRAAIYFDEEDCKALMNEMDEKCMALFSSNYKLDYLKMKDEIHCKKELLYLRLLMVVDFVSSMTDSYARNLYLELSGIK